jgi:hypothetical protein
VYVIAILIGLLLPVAAVALYAGIAVYLVVPGSRTGAAPTAHPPMNAAPAPTTPAGDRHCSVPSLRERTASG